MEDLKLDVTLFHDFQAIIYSSSHCRGESAASRNFWTGVSGTLSVISKVGCPDRTEAVNVDISNKNLCQNVVNQNVKRWITKDSTFKKK